MIRASIGDQALHVYEKKLEQFEVKSRESGIIYGYGILPQPRSQGFSLFVIWKAGKGPGTGRSSMYSDWSMTSTLLSPGNEVDSSSAVLVL